MGTNRERKDPVDGKYKKLMNNTMLFAISNFSSKLLSIVLQPYITFAMGEVEEVGITKLVQNIGSLLIPLVSMGVSFAIIRFGLEKQNSKSQVFTNGLVTILLGFGLMLAFYPLLRLIPLFNTYALLLYVHVLVSCAPCAPNLCAAARSTGWLRWTAFCAARPIWGLCCCFCPGCTWGPRGMCWRSSARTR